VRQTLAEAVAVAFGVPAGSVRVDIGDSSLPHGPTSSASRTTPSVQPTAARAGLRLRDALVTALGSEHGMAGVVAVEGGVEQAGEFVPWSDLWPRLAGTSVTEGRPSDSHFGVTPVAVEGVRFGWGVSDAAHLVEVEVGRPTGEVRVRRVAVALYAGKIHTPRQARSQVHGAIARGIGEALWEARVVDTGTGRVHSDSYDRYRIMRASEMPEIEVVFFEDGFEHAAGGGVGVAELAISSAPAAVVNAVSHAIGARLRTMPLDPQAVRSALAR
jgi:xanthine dehydrogenase YagR molybdenum-binding subunit